MPIRVAIERHVIALEYGKLCALGACGRLQMPLDDVEGLYADGQLEFAPVKPEHGKDFLAAFHLYPPVDITAVRMADGKASIAAYSLDKPKSLLLVEGFVEKTGFELRKPSPDFTKALLDELKALELADYAHGGCVARSMAQGIERAFGACRYANFLHRYKGVALDEAMRRGAEKYGTKLLPD
ncbi:MAG: hypothetical protein QW548_01070 [Candidatus Aenigmatarchaeota archaeon]